MCLRPYRRGRVCHATAVVPQAGLPLIRVGGTGLGVLATVGTVPSVAKYVIYVRVGFAAYLAIVVAVTVLAYQGQRVQQLVIRREVAETWMAEFQAVYRRLFQPRGRHFLRAFLASIAYFGLNYGAGYMILSGFGVSQGLRRYVLSVLLGVAPIISPIPGGAGAAEFVPITCSMRASPWTPSVHSLCCGDSHVLHPCSCGGLLLATR